MNTIIQGAVGVLTTLIFTATAMAGVIAPTLQDVLDTADPKEKIAVIVELNDQLNRKQFKKLKKKLRRLKLLKELKAKAAAKQVSLKTYLVENDGTNMRSLWIINGLAVEAKPKVIRKLASRPEVKEVRLNRPVPLAITTAAASSATQWNVAMIGADLLWAQGYQGQGVVVASMDSGVDYNHAQLDGNWRGGTNSWFDPHGEHTLPYDADGHGTQTMGILAGQNEDGTTIGIAPHAQWIAVKVFDDNGNALVSDIHEGFQWLLDPDGDPNSDDAPDIVNNSWGFPETEDECYTEFQTDIELFGDMEISVVFSAGNQGAGQTSISPANNQGVFSVGAIDESQLIIATSSQGPSACDGGIYPTTVSPGYLVNTADKTFGGVFPNATMLVSGTSFAAPHVSGAMALLMSSDPSLTLAELEAALKYSSSDLGVSGEDNVYGAGLINVAYAYDYLNVSASCGDVDDDGFFGAPSCGTPVDCDDNDATVFPGAPEVGQDGIDQDCNGYDLTINITKALYRASKDKIIIHATSDLGSEAGLTVDIPIIGTKSMTWKANKQRWQKTISKVSTKGLQPDSATVITVTGPEGTETRTLTIK